MRPELRRVIAKEVTLFFSSPIAYLFLAAFLGVTLFVFFWVEAFFARNIADLRPLFEWMPLLLIFLTSTLTMRLWSEERRTGTLEHVMTSPVPLLNFVLGKFLACCLLLALALALTLPLTFTVAWLGHLDWGPVLAGYVAAFCLGAAYISLGLFVSARCDNQIVSLLSSLALGGLFYLVGSPTVTQLVSHQAADWMRLFGTGSRFESITRGIIDLRDLYFYVCMVVVFLALNTFVLERERWSSQATSGRHQQGWMLAGLLVANALAANLWLGQLGMLRVDTTEGKLYSLSPATREYLGQLEQPLLLRGYFSAKTHPLLAPLVPQLQDLMREYAQAGGDKVRVEFVDPADDPEVEQEANQEFGIHPVPMQIADRHQASVVSAYFNVLVKYGDQQQVLGFRDLIELKSGGETNLEVALRNPEYDLTRAIMKTMQAYQAKGSLFTALDEPVKLTAYVSSRLPESLTEARTNLEKVVEGFKKDGGDKLQFEVIEPEADGGQVAKQIAADYGFRPMTTSLLGGDHFYFYLTLSQGDKVVQLSLGEITEAAFKKTIEDGLKRFARGFTKTVALVAPPSGFDQLKRRLEEDLQVVKTDLKDGRVPSGTDLLMVVAPDQLDDKQVFAVDQFLMQGGTVIVASSPFDINFSRGQLAMQERQSGLEDWLGSYGLKLDQQMVLDPHCAALPIPVTRYVGGVPLREVRMLPYPYFVDVREEQEHPILAEVPQATLAWASPITVQEQKSRQVTELLHSSSDSWLNASTEVMPSLDAAGNSGFTPTGSQAKRLLGVVVSGRFDSYFATKKAPVERANLLAHSPDSARLILIASNDFLRDEVLGLMATGSGEYRNTTNMMANAVDWSLEDQGLLSIRGRGHFNRTLPPITREHQLIWEYLNYGLALLALMAVALARRLWQHHRERAYLKLWEVENA
ncbi:MAG: Gldg family protein [Vulcanimicrobiota bacterium]